MSNVVFISAGYNGHDCLLRAICEAAEIPLGLHNGVLGDLMHIIFTYDLWTKEYFFAEIPNYTFVIFFIFSPSSSAKENILYDFYDAELHGTMSMCKFYSKNCPKGIFDWISIFEQR